MVKRIVLALLLAFAIEHTPWRLLGLLGETFWLRPGLTQVVKGNDLYWDARALELRLSALGWTVSYAPSLRGGTAYGVTDIDDHTIQIDSTLEWDARYATLAHEGGHALQTVWDWMDKDSGEAFAESVATIMTHEGLREHARYLSTHKMVLLYTVLFRSAEVYRAAALLQE